MEKTITLRLVVACRGATYEGGRTLAEARAFAADLSRIKAGSPTTIAYIVPGTRGQRREIEAWLTGSRTSAH